MKRLEVQDRMAEWQFAMRLDDLPESVLHKILAQLSASDLAALSMQGRYLRSLVADPTLWQPLSLARWPGADADEQYGGDWHQLYLTRAQQPHGFPLAADRVRVITAVQRRQQAEAAEPAMAGASASAGLACGMQQYALQRLAFEEVIRQAFIAGLACSRDSRLKRSVEWRGLKADITWWATEQPKVVIAYIRSTQETLAACQSGNRGSLSEDMKQRRSAVAFLQELGLLAGAHASVVDRVAAEAAAFDRAIHHVQGGARCGDAGPAVRGVPASHWWFS